MSESLANLFLQNCPFDLRFCFREWKISDEIFSKISRVDWLKIVSWIPSEKDLLLNIQELPYSLAALVYTRKETDVPFNFILLLRDHPADNYVITFHGGSWCSPFISFRTGRQLIQALSRCGFKVRTSIKTDNRAAQKFVEALGMKKSTRKNNVFWYKWPYI